MGLGETLNGSHVVAGFAAGNKGGCVVRFLPFSHKGEGKRQKTALLSGWKP
jgi:hypothetical protein